ncbi:MAG TPA: hypothetical protein VFQ88_06900 [Nevskiaceae bacterium]|nr:hypothetical protein [Nevskiaceae bacterium]
MRSAKGLAGTGASGKAVMGLAAGRATAGVERALAALCVAAAVVLAGCSGSAGSVNGNDSATGGAAPAGDTGTPPMPPSVQPPTQPAVALDRYTIANGCYAVKSLTAAAFLTRGSDGSYTANAADPAKAAGFFMKPSDLGKYMFYASNQMLLADENGVLTTIAAPRDKTGWKVNDGVIWVINGDSNSQFTAHSDAASTHSLGVGKDGKLEVETTGAAQGLMFVPVAAAQCTAFPEISTDTVGQTFDQAETYNGNGANEPLVGWADVHSHITATGFLGGAHAGRPFSEYGVTAALPDAKTVHGPDNHLDLIGNLYGGKPLASADTVGWPTFKSWPAYDQLTFESAYYRWIKRAYLAGERLLVDNFVQNDALCQLEEVAKNANPDDLMDLLKNTDGAVTGLIGPTCQGMATADRQFKFLHKMQDYIDAQSGGPGKGWFRIVTTPEQATEVIKQGKLAVVQGIEISNVFGCHVIIPAGLGQSADVPMCDEKQITAELNHLYNDLGVRQIYLVHELNNALGGNGIFNGTVINVGNFWDTGSFWQTHDCPTSDPTGDYKDYYYAPGAIMSLSTDVLSDVPSNPLSPVLEGASGLLDGLLQGVLPMYNTKVRQCNVRGITNLGRFALHAVMQKGMIVDVDHQSVKMKGQVIDIARQQTPAYPVISGHGGHGGITMDQAREIMADGGLIAPIDCTAATYLSNLKKLETVLPAGATPAMSCSSDINGMAAQPWPDPKGDTITYPFTLFQGSGWSNPMFVGMQPLVFDESSVPEGHKEFNYNTDGVAEYGLYADRVQAIALAGGAPAVAAYFRSAQQYINTWKLAREVGSHMQ